MQQSQIIDKTNGSPKRATVEKQERAEIQCECQKFEDTGCRYRLHAVDVDA